VSYGSLDPYVEILKDMKEAMGIQKNFARHSEASFSEANISIATQEVWQKLVPLV